MSQKDAAIEAVQKIGLNQIADIEKQWFTGKEPYYEMLSQRLDILKSAESHSTIVC